MEKMLNFTHKEKLIWKLVPDFPPFGVLPATDMKVMILHRFTNRINYPTLGFLPI